MAISVKLSLVDRFDRNGLIINHSTQFVDENELGYYEGEGLVDLHRNGTDFIQQERTISPYFVEYYLRHEQQGFVFEKDFKYYFTKHKFNSYLTSDGLFLLTVKKKVAESFLKELGRETGKRTGARPFIFKNVTIDFDRIIANSENVTGLWSQVGRGNLTSQAFFGDQVTEDAEVQIAIAQQKTSFVQFDITLDGKLFKIGITKEGSIVFYKGFPKDSSNEVVLATALSIYDLLIK